MSELGAKHRKRIDVRVWRLSDAEVCCDDLSLEEIARADRFTSRADASRFASAHRRTRIILASYLGLAPGAIAFVAGAHGKPRLSEAHGSTLKFNLTHSEGVAALAVADGLEVGVDIERVRPVKEDIAARFFSPRERAALAAAPPEETTHAFFECWTGKEAFVKALGEGLSMPLDAFDVEFGPQASPFVRVHADPLGPTWRLWRFAPAPGFVGALVAGASGRWDVDLQGLDGARPTFNWEIGLKNAWT